MSASNFYKLVLPHLNFLVYANGRPTESTKVASKDGWSQIGWNRHGDHRRLLLVRSHCREFWRREGSSLLAALFMSLMSETSPHTSIDVVDIYILETAPRYGLANSVAEYSRIDGAVRRYGCIKINIIR